MSRHDLEPGTVLAGLLRLLRPGADLVVTDGPAGGRLARLGRDGRARTRPYAAVAPIREVDPTGAGDVFLAALLASLVRPEAAGRAARSGVPPRPGVRGRGGLVRRRGPRAARGSRAARRSSVASGGTNDRSHGSADGSGDRAPGADGDAAPQTIVASDQVGLERRFWPADAATPLDQGEAAQDRRQRGVSVAEAMLLELGQLDRGDDRVPTRTGRKGLPGLGRVLVPAHSSENARPVDGDPLGRPGRIERRSA